MISIVIPVFNKEKSISRTIESVLRQTYSSFELIIVNDGSSDNSLSKIRNFSDGRIVIVDQENMGVSSARNAGVEKAQYNIIALLDGDDIWDQNYLEEMDKFILKFPDASLYGCGYSFFQSEEDTHIPDLGVPPGFMGYINYFDLAINNTLYTSSSALFKKSDFLSLGGFDPCLNRGEDIDLWIRFALSRKVAFYNKVMVTYRLDSENRAQNNVADKNKSLIWKLDKYRSYETNNKGYKKFIDNWRLAHIGNYLKGISTEISNPKPLLNDIDLKKKSKLWSVLKYTPLLFNKLVYSVWINLSRIKNN